MKLRTLGIVGLTSVAVAVPSAAHAGCLPDLVHNAQTVDLDVSIASGSNVERTFQVRVRNDAASGGPCKGTLRIARRSAGTAKPVAYEIRSGAQIVDILPDETSPSTVRSDLPVSSLPQGASGAAVPFKLSVPTSWAMPAGTVIDDLVVQLIDESGRVADTQQLTIRLQVASSVEVRIVGATGDNTVASVDLGTLDPAIVNRSAPFGVRVWSTSPYTISFTSQNNGALKHVTLPRTIDYRLLMSGVPVSVAGLPARVVSQATTSLGEVYPLAIEVDPFTADAGDYSDRVEVTVSAT